ncbi:Substrate-binding region of ABC-type glycine betaine transport system [Syntrophobotulus glycolicus DSM 8271]|uniref:Substrate-binding region of ABC-type glycine betaine transport system n=1 Tax=Syntrophobotulus glycolicus (strain DSM 8271 / FlGlyR) TaxID=645991 RepID=F0SYQ4_SYNGF|nr:glycine betaine ABC transporter substrate-binding protein [Syntrophobotulus glycolicus]ADY54855.1 Substrate-binding region of ABC-type glycine betaine transport system [Syntrophobotulus glycolicus DSM 8271]
MRRHNGWKRLILTGMIAVLMISLMAGCSTDQSNKPAEGKGTVNIGYVNWAECIAASNLWKVILEDQNYTVNLTQLDVAPLFVGLNKGDIDVFMDAWLPITHQTYWNEYKDTLEDYGIWYQEPAKIGIVVPKYVTLDSIAQLKENGDKFEKKIIGIDAGAGIMKAAAAANKKYALGFDVVQGSEPAMMAALDNAYAKNEWIAVTGWSPHWMFAKYSLKYLDDPEKEFGEAEEIHIVANNQFSGKQPDVAAMLKKFKMTDAQIGTLEDFINNGMQPSEAAKKWIAENKDTVDEWIKE